jgi:uncharacterized short protein YbdD (DUF466 family)
MRRHPGQFTMQSSDFGQSRQARRIDAIVIGQ